MSTTNGSVGVDTASANPTFGSTHTVRGKRLASDTMRRRRRRRRQDHPYPYPSPNHSCSLSRAELPILRSRPPPSRKQSTLLGASFLILLSNSLLPARAFTFTWSSTSYQCVTQELKWSGGTPPFTAVIAPLLQFPFVYRIPTSAFDSTTSTGSYPLQVQMTSGLQYVVFMSDGTGVGTGGSSGLTTVQGYQDSTCLASAGTNQSDALTTFMTSSANVRMCQSSFDVQWDTGTATGPFNMTVIPLEQEFVPFDVPLGSNGTYEWQVNLNAGDHFTVMMNDALALGVGGVAGSYTVNATETANTACLDDPATTTVGSATGTGTSTGTGTATGGAAPPSGGISGKIIAVVATIGAVIGIIASAIATFLFIVIRRRRREAASSSSSGNGKGRPMGDVDLWDPAPSDDEGHDGGARPGRDESPGGMDSPSDINLHSYSPVSAGSRSARYANLPTATSPSILSAPTSAGAAGNGVITKDGLSWPGDGGGIGSSSSRTRGGGRHATRASADSLGAYENPFAGSMEDIASMGGMGLDTSPVPHSAVLYGDPLRDAVVDERSPQLRNTKSDEAAGPSSDGLAYLSSTARQTSPAPRQPPSTNNFRVTNAGADDPIAPEHSGVLPESTSTLASTASQTTSQTRRYQQPRFVRHEDAGIFEGAAGSRRDSREVIDLPPLYTDVIAGRGENSPGLSPGPESADSGLPLTADSRTGHAT